MAEVASRSVASPVRRAGGGYGRGMKSDSKRVSRRDETAEGNGVRRREAQKSSWNSTMAFLQEN